MKILSDPRRRQIYDEEGEEGLYGDVPPEDDDFFDESYYDSDDHSTDQSFSGSYHPPPPSAAAPPPPTSKAPQPPGMAAPQPPPKRNPTIPQRDCDTTYSERRSASEKVYSSDYSEYFSHPYSSDSMGCGTQDSGTRRTSPSPSVPLRTTKPQAPPSMDKKQSGHTRPHGTHHVSHTDPYDIFRKFFGTQDFRQAASMGDGFSFFDNPSLTSSQRNSQEDAYPPQHSSSSQTQEEEPAEVIIDPPIIRNYFCSLEDLYE